jgi:hypothetical protein
MIKNLIFLLATFVFLISTNLSFSLFGNPGVTFQFPEEICAGKSSKILAILDDVGPVPTEHKFTVTLRYATGGIIASKTITFRVNEDVSQKGRTIEGEVRYDEAGEYIIHAEIKDLNDNSVRKTSTSISVGDCGEKPDFRITSLKPYPNSECIDGEYFTIRVEGINLGNGPGILSLNLKNELKDCLDVSSIDEQSYSPGTIEPGETFYKYFEVLHGEKNNITVTALSTPFDQWGKESDHKESISRNCDCDALFDFQLLSAFSPNCNTLAIEAIPDDEVATQVSVDFTVLGSCRTDYTYNVTQWVSFSPAIKGSDPIIKFIDIPPLADSFEISYIDEKGDLVVGLEGGISSECNICTDLIPYVFVSDCKATIGVANMIDSEDDQDLEPVTVNAIAYIRYQANPEEGCISEKQISRSFSFNNSETKDWDLPDGTYKIEAEVGCIKIDIDCDNNSATEFVSCPCQACAGDTIKIVEETIDDDNCNKYKIQFCNPSSDASASPTCPIEFKVDLVADKTRCSGPVGAIIPTRINIKSGYVPELKGNKCSSIYTLKTKEIEGTNPRFEVFINNEDDPSLTLPINPNCSKVDGLGAFDIVGIEILPTVRPAGENGTMYVKVKNTGNGNGTPPTVILSEWLQQGYCTNKASDPKNSTGSVSAVLGPGELVKIPFNISYTEDAVVSVEAKFDYSPDQLFASCNFGSGTGAYTSLCEEDISFTVSPQGDCSTSKTQTFNITFNTDSNWPAIKPLVYEGQSSANCISDAEQDKNFSGSIPVSLPSGQKSITIQHSITAPLTKNDITFTLEYYDPRIEGNELVDYWQKLSETASYDCECDEEIEVSTRETDQCWKDGKAWISKLFGSVPSGIGTLYHIEWSNGEKDVLSIGDLEPGSVSVTVTNIVTGLSVTASGTVEKPESDLELVVSGGGLVPFCLVDPEILAVLQASASGGCPPYSYNWNDDGVPGKKNVSEVGTQTATVTDDKGNTASADGEVEYDGEYEITVTISAETGGLPMCPSTAPAEGEKSLMLQASASGGCPPYTYSWNDDGVPGRKYVSSPGEHFCIAEDAMGMAGKGSVTLQKPREPLIRAIIQGGQIDVPFCANIEPTRPKILLLGGGSGDCTPITLSWPDGKKEVSGSGTYSLSATDAAGNSDRDEISVVYIPTLCALDPNEIIGPDGYGESRFVSKTSTLDYTILYENDPEFAANAASRVEIRLPLDPDVALSSFRLKDFGFGDFVFQVPVNVSSYHQRLDLRDSKGIFLDVIAGVDVINKRAFWIFQSIDPKTGLPPNELNTGYLPVNDKALKNGEGFVKYSWKPGNKVETGETIEATAEIFFDINEPIVTNTHKNTIDAGSPITWIEVPEDINATGTLMLNFKGNDDNNGSGIARYMLYVSENNGKFYHMRDVDTSFLLYKGQNGSNYKFFSRAVDNTGNTEILKNSPEDSVVIEGSFMPMVDIQGDGTICPDDTALIVTSKFNDWRYQWYRNNEPLIDQTDHILLASSAGKYKVLVQDTSSLIYGVSSEIEIKSHNQTIKPQIIISEASQCQIDSLKISAQQDYASYLWSNGMSTKSIVIHNSGVYTLSVVDLNSCKAVSDPVNFVIPGQTIPQIESAAAGICEGDSVLLSVKNDYDAYLWSHGPVTKEVWAKQPGIYNANVLDSRGCSFQTNTIQLNEYSSPMANFSYSFDGQKVIFTNLTTNAASYRWEFENGFISTDINPVIESADALLGTSVTLFAFNQNCQGKFSSQIEIASGSSVSIYGKFRIYPNPSSGKFWIELPELRKSCIVKVTDILGKVKIIHSYTNQTKVELDLSAYTAGIYIIEVTSGNKVFHERVVLKSE